MTDVSFCPRVKNSLYWEKNKNIDLIILLLSKEGKEWGMGS